jgi:hypothetical protein
MPAGWYPDRAGVTRYWDGTNWTDHTAPAAAAPPPTVVPAAPVGYAPPRETVTFTRRRVNHVLHGVLTLLTAGLWSPIWLLAVLRARRSRNEVVTQYR